MDDDRNHTRLEHSVRLMRNALKKKVLVTLPFMTLNSRCLEIISIRKSCSDSFHVLRKYFNGAQSLAPSISYAF